MVTGKEHPSGHVVVLDDDCGVIAPLCAVGLAENGTDSVKIVTRWPMIGLDTILDVYLDWILPKVYKAGVEMVTSHFVKSIEGGRVTLYNVHDEESELVLDADWLIMVTARTSENQLYALVEGPGPERRDGRRRDRPPRHVRGRLRRSSPGEKGLMRLASVVAGGERWAAVVEGDRAFVTDVPGLDAAISRRRSTS